MKPASRRRTRHLGIAAILSLCGGCQRAVPAAATHEITSPPPSKYTEFESGAVRPLALSADRRWLYATNTPDGRLEILQPSQGGLKRISSVTVGLEPVAVAARPSSTEVWVVNHVSDSVSVVDVGDPQHPRVTRTLHVGDEPRDIVFAGPGFSQAYITTAHRGQNTGRDPQLTTPGVGRADVWVFNANSLGDSSLAGTPLAVLSFFTDTPRALVATPDGSRVYVAGFQTGNRTTTVNALIVNAPGAPGAPPPLTNYAGVPAPPSGLIVQKDLASGHWVDERGPTVPWDSAVKFNLPDKDVFAINALANPPAALDGTVGPFANVGTILFNLAINPVSGKVYASNLESFNLTRFEGPGTFAGHRGVQGHLAESRITVINPSSGAVTPRHLNKHIDYSQCCAPLPNAENAKSLAFPTGMVVSHDGQTLWVAALGSSKVGVYSTAALEANTFTPSLANQIPVTGGGPSGLVLDESRGQLYVFTRFDDAISVVDTGSKREVAHVAMFNPEPTSIVAGRRFLYDAALTSSHGDSACASCHVFGDFDSLAWDLGNPDGDPLDNLNPTDNDIALLTAIFGLPTSFHPMKGPMTTQSLRGMANHGPMHWRGDRTGSLEAPNAQPDSGAFDENAGFHHFNPAFVSLIGRSAQLAPADMDAFTSFILQVAYPPNPIRNLDNSDTPDQAAARAFYFSSVSTAVPTGTQAGSTCVSCHGLNPTANAEYGVQFPGLFGSDGRSTFVFEPQILKNPHLRNQYQKVGMFGNPSIPSLVLPGNNDFQGDQVRGFGFLHDGSVDTDFRFLSTTLFVTSPINPGGFPVSAAGDVMRRQMESLMLAFDSNFAPIVGQQVTLSRQNATIANARVDLLEARADAGECDLIAKGAPGGAVYVGHGSWRIDHQAAPAIGDAVLRAAALVSAATFTCTPPGSGLRMGVDRDLDGVWDGDEPH